MATARNEKRNPGARQRVNVETIARLKRRPRCQGVNCKRVSFPTPSAVRSPATGNAALAGGHGDEKEREGRKEEEQDGKNGGVGEGRALIRSCARL